jgi:uncharacterized protein (DUF2336 family)
VRTDVSLLTAFEHIANHVAPPRQAEILDQITGFFLDGAKDFGEQHVRLFDEIFNRLVGQIEAAARSKLSVSLASVSHAPPQIVRRLADDDDINVARPVLQNSELLDELDLIDLANGKSQEHLLAIAGRGRVTAAVTDILVRRGDHEVLRSVAANSGAAISPASFNSLVSKAGKDILLAEAVGQRGDIPEPLFRVLLLEATTIVRKRLLAAANPEHRLKIGWTLTTIATELKRKAARNRASTKRVTPVVANYTRDQSAIIKLADEGRYKAAIAALAARCEIPLAVVDRIATNKHKDPALILCKSAGVGWSTARAVILSRAQPQGIPDLTLDNKRRAFERMSTEAARDVIRIWKTLYQAPAGAE